jgi:hypothetical protein
VLCVSIIYSGIHDLFTPVVVTAVDLSLFYISLSCLHIAHFVQHNAKGYEVRGWTSMCFEKSYYFRLVYINLNSVMFRNGFYMKRILCISHTHHLGSEPFYWVTALTGITSWTCRSYANIGLWWRMRMMDWIIAYKHLYTRKWEGKKHSDFHETVNCCV